MKESSNPGRLARLWKKTAVLILTAAIILNSTNAQLIVYAAEYALVPTIEKTNQGTLHQIKPIQRTPLQTKPSQRILYRTKPFQDTLRRTNPSQSTLHRTKSFQDTLHQITPYQRTLFNKNNQLTAKPANVTESSGPAKSSGTRNESDDRSSQSEESDESDDSSESATSSESDSKSESSGKPEGNTSVEKDESSDPDHSGSQDPDNLPDQSNLSDQDNFPDQDSSQDSDTPDESTSAADPEEDLLEETQESKPALKAPALRSTGSDINHNVTMPDVTSHYFLLQKESKIVGSASGPNLKVANTAKEAEQYIFKEYPNGTEYNFTPTMGKDTEVRVGGGDGGRISLDAAKNGTYARYGAVQEAAQEGASQTCAFNLAKCKSDPYAIYTNVGTWYDVSSGITYGIDLKLSITDYLFPDASIRSQLQNTSMDAPYMAFRNDIIGVDSMATDSITMHMDFYYAGTTTPVEGLRGIVQYCDIDSQQGVDFGNGFEKVILFDTGSSHIQYNSRGLASSSVGYVSSRVNRNLKSSDMETTAVGLFSGSSVDCVWTLSRCDQKDTGGNAAYAVKGGYQIPADSSETEAKSYYVQSSTGMVAVRADVGLAPLPGESTKAVYFGGIEENESSQEDTVLRLNTREQVFTYVVKAAAPMPSNIRKARYTDFAVNDTVDPLLKVRDVKVFASDPAGNEEGDQLDYTETTGSFVITRTETDDHGTLVTVSAKEDALLNLGFYGHTYYVHIEVETRSDEELKEAGHDISQWYQEDNSLGQLAEDAGDLSGSFAVDNQGSIDVVNSSDIHTELKTNHTITRYTLCLSVKKTDQASREPVEGVLFGLFGGQDTEDPKEENAIMTVKTDKNGIAVFESSEEEDFFEEKYGAGPYCIKEISVPEAYRSVWDTSVQKKWVCQIETLRDGSLIKNEKSGQEIIPDTQTMENHNTDTPGGAVRVFKKSAEDGAILAGAEFTLYQWSEKEKAYTELGLLTEVKDDKGRFVHSWKEELINTMDNLGRYRIAETKAPKGCVLTGKAWTFTLDDKIAEDGSNLVYELEGGKTTQTGQLVYKNPIQKSILSIYKENEDGEALEGVRFSVYAAEDIYAPWNLDQDGKPMDGAEPLIAKGTLADEITTGKDGKGSSHKGNELYIGRYLVKETGGAGGHIKEDQEKEIALSYGTDQTQAFVTYQLDITNRRMHPAFAVAKLAGKTRNPEGKEVAFDAEKGRYTEEKTAGSYLAGERLEFAITVTNTGDVPLYRVVLHEDMTRGGDHALAQYVDQSTATFVIPAGGTFSSVKGRKLTAGYDDQTPLELTLDRLDAGDSVEVRFTVNLKKDAANAYQLENAVYGTAFYDDNEKDPEDRNLVPVDTENLKDVDGNSLTEDSDRVNVPGHPGGSLLKQADRTTGITVKNGEVRSGFKVPGTYGEGETIRYTMTVKNTGTAFMKDILLTDRMSEELSKVVDKANAGFVLGQGQEAEADLTTAGGRKVHARRVSADQLILCEGADMTTGEGALAPGDYVEVPFTATVLKDAAGFYDLANTATMNSWYYDGQTDREIPEETDYDQVEIPGRTEARAAKLADKTTGAVLKDGRYDSDAKITGTYRNGQEIIYTVTVTNSGTAGLYQLILEDKMSPELLAALDEDSITFMDGEYQTTAGHKMRTRCKDPRTLQMDYLAAGDSAKVILKARVRNDVGNLFALRNDVVLTAKYVSGKTEEEALNEEAGKEENKEYQLIYHSASDTDSAVSDSETPCKKGSKISINGNPFSYEGYSFIGWNEKEDGSGKMIMPDASYTMPARDVHLYAQWAGEAPDQRPAARYRLFYYSDNPLGQMEADEENSVLEGSGITVDENHFVYEGYTFAGWNTLPDGRGRDYSPKDVLTMPGHDVNLYAKWRKNETVTLTYEANEGSDRSRIDVETPCQPGQDIQIDGNDYLFEREDGDGYYHFAGWNSRPDGSGQAYEPGDSCRLTSSMTLYAQWEVPEDEEERQYSLAYRANNGTSKKTVDGETPAEQGDEISLEANPFSYEGYTFIGWNSKADGSGSSYKVGDSYTMPGKDVTLYAIWERTDSVKVTYHSNTGKEETMVDAQTPAATDSDILLDGNYFSNGRYTFAGWNEKADGSGQTYSPGQEIRLTGNLDLYAVWKDMEEKYKLTYHSNPVADAGEEMTEADSETPAFAGLRISINPNRFRIKGYQFTGWNEKADGSGKSYQGKNIYLMPARDVDLYAQWEKEKEEETVTPEEPSGQEPIDPNLPSAAEESRKKAEEAYRQVQAMDLDDALKENAFLDLIPQTELMEDHDLVNVPGQAEAVVAKLADLTTGVTLTNGRYSGQKVEGTYVAGDPVNYAITVTNTGTADLYELNLDDVMEADLLDSLQADSIVFDTGKLVTGHGKAANVSAPEKTEADQDSDGKKTACHTAVIDKLAAGDSLEIHLRARIASGVKDQDGLKNTVTLTGQYYDSGDDGKPELTWLDDNEKMTDQDTIGTGQPTLAVAKTADKTTGISLERGRYTGERKAGSYEAGETVGYSITLSNLGTAAARDIVVTESPSRELAAYLDPVGFQLEENEELDTDQGNVVQVKAAGESTLTLDLLEPGDSLTLDYRMTVKKEIRTVRGLANHVKVDGKNSDNTDLDHTSLMDDSDKIDLETDEGVEDPDSSDEDDDSDEDDEDYDSSSGRYDASGDDHSGGNGSGRSGSTGSSGNAKTGDDNRPLAFSLIMLFSFAGICIILFRRREEE